MNKKILIIFVALVVAMTAMPVSVFAKDNSSISAKAAKIATLKAKQDLIIQKIEQKQILAWKRLGDRLINKDIAKLNFLIARTNKKTTLTADQKTVILSDINADITSLTTLKTKIDTGTDLPTIKIDVKSIMSVGSINSNYLLKINQKTTTVKTS